MRAIEIEVLGGCIGLVYSLATPSALNAQPAPATPCTLAASADRSELSLGERFVVEVKGTAPPGATWTFPAEAGGEAVPLRAQPAAAGGSAPGLQRYDATALDVGEAQVDAIEAKCHLGSGQDVVARSSPLRVRVASALPKDAAEQKLADIRPPLALSIGRVFWGAVGLALLGGALAIGLWWRWRAKSATVAAISPLRASPEAEARAALAQLEQADWIGREHLREFYIALAQIVKRYLERRLAGPVLEMTSGELVAFLRREGRPADWIGLVRELTGAADQVKFANAAGQREEAQRHCRVAETVVATVERTLQPAAGVLGKGA